MELHQLSAEEIRGFDPAKIRETEGEIRQALVTIRMDIYTAKNQHTAKIRGLRKSLARLLTVKTAIKAAAPKAAKVAKVAPAKAPKAVKAPKAEAAAPKAAKASPKDAKSVVKAKTSTKKK